MSDSVAWCILAGFKITSVFSRITYHIIESMCEFVVSILEAYMHREKKTLTFNFARNVQKKKEKAAVKLIQAGCQSEVESENNYNSNANKPTVTRKDKTEDKNGNALFISGQRFCFRGTDKVIECNLREARKVTLSFDFYPFQDQSTLELYGPSTVDRTSDANNKTAGNVTTSNEPSLPTSSNQISDQSNESELTRIYGSKCKGDFVLDDSCPEQNVFETDYRKHTMKHTEAMKLDTESKDKTDSISKRGDASSEKIEEKRDPDKRHPVPPVYTETCPTAPFEQIQDTVAHIDEHADQRLSLVPVVYQTVDHKHDYEATGYQMQDPEPTFDQKQNTKIPFNPMQCSEAIVDQEDIEPTVDQKKRPVSSVGKEKRLEDAVEQKQVPKAAVDYMQDSGADVEEIQGPEAIVKQKEWSETTVTRQPCKKEPAADDNQKKSQEVIIDQKQDMKSRIDQNQDLESIVGQNQGHVDVIYQKEDQVAPIDQSTEKKQGSPASVDKKSPVDLINRKRGKSIDKKCSPVNVGIKQGAGASFNMKTGARDSGEKKQSTADPNEKRGTVFSAEKKQVSAVPTDKKKGATFSVDKRQSSEVIVEKKKGDETFMEKTDMATFVVRQQGTAVPADKKKDAVALVHKKESLEVPVDKKQGLVVSVDQKKDSLARIGKTVDKAKASTTTGNQKQSSAAPIHPSTSKNRDLAPSTCKEKVDSKREPEYTSSATDRKSVPKGVKDKSNLKCPQGDFRKGEDTQTFSKTGNETKVFESASERSAQTETGASKILSEASQSTSGVEKVPETSGKADGVKLDSEMTRDTYSIEPTTKESKCSEASEVENFADVSEVSKKNDTLGLVTEAMEDHKAVEPDSKISGDENRGGLYQESSDDKLSHQKQSTGSNDSSATSEEDSLNSFDSRLEKGPSIVISPDVLLNPHMPLDMLRSTDNTVEKTEIFEKEYLQGEWDDTDKYFYDHVIEREKEMGHIDPSTFVEGPSDQKAVFETKNKKSQKDDNQSEKSYGKVVDIYNPLTELPKYYDVISLVDSKYLLEKSIIKCYTKQEDAEDPKTVEIKQNISDREGSLETEHRNNEGQSTQAMGRVNLLAEATLAVEKEESKTLMEGEALEKSGKTYAETGARTRTYRRRNYH